MLIPKIKLIKNQGKLIGLVNEWYLEDLSENIKKTFDSKRKQGLHIGSFVVYGYKRDQTNKNKLIIDEEAAHTVHWIYDLYESGNGICKIAHILNTNHIPPPTKYKQQNGLKFQNRKGSIDLWSESTIRKILKNQVYIGNLVQGYNKKLSYKNKKSKALPPSEWIIVPHTHEPIIEKKQFDRVQSLLQSKTKACKNGEVHIFCHKLICMDCGAKLYKCQNKKGYIFFSCSNARTSKQLCSRHSIGYESLKKLVARKITRKNTTVL